MTTFLDPTTTEFAEGLLKLCGPGLLSDVKQRLVPVALNVIRGSLLSHRPPHQSLQSFHDLHCHGLIRRPHAESPINRLLDQVECHPELRGLMTTLAQPAIRQRLKIEWLYDMTLDRFECAFPFLQDEEELLSAWKAFCDAPQDISFNPHVEAQNAARKNLPFNESKLSDEARRLHDLSFLAACRKLFVHLSGAKETWAGPYATRSFALDEAIANPLPSSSATNDRSFSMRFGHVEHVFYVKPTLEQMQLYLAYIGDETFMRAIQSWLCPFVSKECEEMNYLAGIFYQVFQAGVRRGNSSEDESADPLRDLGANRGFLKRFAFRPLNSKMVELVTGRLSTEKRLHAFLHHPRTESGLIRQRLYRGTIAPMLDELVEQSLCTLCRQWNPMIQTEEGTNRPLISIIESKSSVVTDDACSAGWLRQWIECGELFRILDRNTEAWLQELNRDGFIVDRERFYFMTLLEKALNEIGPEGDRREKYEDIGRIACVAVA